MFNEASQICSILRIHFIQQWFGLIDRAMEDALHDMALFRDFVQLDAVSTRSPDDYTILRFRYFLVAHKLAIPMLVLVIARLIDRGLMLKRKPPLT